VLAILPGLVSPEIGQRIREGPSRRTFARPSVEIGAVAAGIGQDIDRRCATKDFASQQREPTVAEMGFRLGRVAPVEHLMLLKLTKSERDLNVRMAVIPAGLE
jgi:hypothetical protein